MPLVAGDSEKAKEANFKELTHRGTQKRSRTQIIAIVMSKARESKKRKYDAGDPPAARSGTHAGPEQYARHHERCLLGAVAELYL